MLILDEQEAINWWAELKQLMKIKVIVSYTYLVSHVSNDGLKEPSLYKC